MILIKSYWAEMKNNNNYISNYICNYNTDRMILSTIDLSSPSEMFLGEGVLKI